MAFSSIPLTRKLSTMDSVAVPSFLQHALPANPFDPDLITPNASTLYGGPEPSGGISTKPTSSSSSMTLPYMQPALLTEVTLRLSLSDARKKRLDDVLTPHRATSGMYSTQTPTTDLGTEVSPERWSVLHVKWVESLVDLMRWNLSFNNQQQSLPSPVFITLENHPVWKSFSLVLWDQPNTMGNDSAGTTQQHQRSLIFTFHSQCRSLHRILRQMDVPIDPHTTCDGPNGDASSYFTIRRNSAESCHAVLSVLLNLAYKPYEHGKVLESYLPTLVASVPFAQGVYQPFRIPIPIIAPDHVVVALSPSRSFPSSLLFSLLLDLQG
eukprot:PhF_6_TR32962/c0_g1_i4/m.48516